MSAAHPSRYTMIRPMPRPLATALGWLPWQLALLVPLLLAVATGMRLGLILKSPLISTTG